MCTTNFVEFSSNNNSFSLQFSFFVNIAYQISIIRNFRYFVHYKLFTHESTQLANRCRI